MVLPVYPIEPFIDEKEGNYKDMVVGFLIGFIVTLFLLFFFMILLPARI